MSDLQTSLVVNLAGNLAQRAQKYARSMEQMSERGQRSMRMLNRSASLAGKGLDKLGNRYTTLITGAGLTLAGRQVMGLETRFERLGIQANKSKAEMDALKQTIFDVAQEKEIRVDPSQITSAIEAIVEKTGDLEFAEKNIRNIAMAIQATGAAGSDIGETLGEFQKGTITLPAKVMEALDILNVQGKEGAFTLQNLASLGPRVMTAYASVGRTGTQAMREMGAALQVIRMGTGGPEETATAFEALIRTLTDPAKIKILQGSGIKLFDPEAAKEGKRVLLPINQIMEDIVRKTNGDKVKLGIVFDAEGIRAFNSMSAEYLQTGGFASIHKFMNVQADGTTTMRDSARAAKTSEAALQNLFTAWQQFQNNQLAKPIQDAADALNSLEPGTVQNWLEIGKNIALVGAAAVILKKSAGVFGTLRDMRKGGKAGGIGGAISSMGAQRVFVVNMPGMGMGGGASNRTTGTGGTVGGSTGTKGARKGSLSYTSPAKVPPSKWSKIAKYTDKLRGGKFGKFGGPAVAATVGSIGAYNTWTSDKSTSEKVKDTVGIAGGVGGSVAGGWIGALALSWIPIIGPPLGYAIGGAIGYTVGDKVASELSKVSLSNGSAGGKAPRMTQQHEQSALSFVEAMKTSLDSSEKQVQKNRRQAAQESREASRAELKVTLDDSGRLKATSVKTSPGLNLDIAGNSMGSM